MEKATPYVGITGATSKKEARLITQTFLENGFIKNGTHLPMVGFLASQKTLNGEQIQNKRYPKIDSLKSIISACGKQVFTTIHYNTREIDTLALQIKKLFGNGIYHENLCRAVQLNIEWQNIEQLTQIKKIKDYMPDMKIIFQANKTTTKDGVNGLLNFLYNCRNEISYVLLDPSSGGYYPNAKNSNDFDLKIAVEQYKGINNEFPNLTIGFAGGFTGDNVFGICSQLYEELTNDDFCIDAESGLRDKIGDGHGNDQLNEEKVTSYVQNSAKIFTRKFSI